MKTNIDFSHISLYSSYEKRLRQKKRVIEKIKTPFYV
jgi:hypothetical protein